MPSEVRLKKIPVVLGVLRVIPEKQINVTNRHEKKSDGVFANRGICHDL